MFALAVLLLLVPTKTAGSKSDAGQHGGCIAREREALLSIKAGITDDPYGLLLSWQGQDCCRWMGVRCSNRTGHVITLDLHAEHDPYSLKGQISSSLKALEHLQHLDLSGNHNLLAGPGGRLPHFLGSLYNLRYLNLSGLNCYGMVPHQLGNLSMLLNLGLAYDSRQLYSADLSWLRHLSLLKHLDMTSVDLSNVTGWVDTVNMLSSLEVLKLSGCGLHRDENTVHFPPHSNFTMLKILDLSLNFLDTSGAVNLISRATSLKHLNLNYNLITGLLPAEFRNLSSLEVLQMSNNNIRGMVPGALTNLCDLKIFELTCNKVEGDMEEFLERLPKCSWRKLKMLKLGYNNINGSLPDWINHMTSLSTLDISFNRLTGTLTTGIGSISNLTYLDLGYNQMSGLITEEHFSKLSYLQHLHLSANSFTMEWDSDWVPPFSLQTLGLKSCCLGPEFPQWLRWQKNISSLFMSNASIVDTMPDWFWNVFSKAVILDISSNNISGTLPDTLGQMEASLLDLSSNQFSGSVVHVPKQIVILDLSRNILSGPLPLDFQRPELVNGLLLSNNYFTGTIPTSICKLKLLSFFDIGNNMITGQLPQCSQDMASASGMRSTITSSPITVSGSDTQMFMSLRPLRLDNNSLSGGFPVLLKNCPELTFIDLGQNMFSGSIPTWIGKKLAQLAILRLRSNMFSGHIPTQLRKLGQLQYLDLAQNNFSGTIPQSLLNMDGATDTIEAFIYHPVGIYSGDDEVADNLGPPSVSISAVTKGREREYIGEIVYMVSLDLSCNHLTGDIPKRIGPKKGLVNMNLSRNHLTGKIPENIGSMHLLESLDLSYNKLSGEIPSSLSDLTSLSYLNLSYNDLSGRIPSGHQLDTLSISDPASMYIGNTGLCGPPLQKNCSGSGTVQIHFTPRKGPKIMTFYFGLSTGFVVGLWTVLCSLLFNKTWMASYFRLFDKMYDKIYGIIVLKWATMVMETKTTD